MASIFFIGKSVWPCKNNKKLNTIFIQEFIDPINNDLNYLLEFPSLAACSKKMKQWEIWESNIARRRLSRKKCLGYYRKYDGVWSK